MNFNNLRYSLFFFIILFVSGVSGIIGQSNSGNVKLFSIDGSVPAVAPETGYLQMGGSDAAKSPGGHELTVNSRYLMMDNKPWLPVMGEFHFSRCPEKYWEEEILKMKAGGVQIISTYIFWIHHEEIEGQFDWSGSRDLRKFVELCGKYGMYVYPRIGPWAHGEARNGGFPDWLIAKCQTRVNDSTYLSYVKKFYDEIEKQLKGLLWKDGGPVIGTQIENEYSNRASNGGSAYLAMLKALAIDAGIDVPLYTVTGWDNAVIPPHIAVPVYGGYPDEPWSGSIHELAPDPEGVYQFHVKTPTGTAGIMQAVSTTPENIQLSHYPKFTAELGGGMEDTYHRRVVISGDDIAAMALTAVGSGNNLLGYYMFHGGTNPDGKLTTLQESQATGYPNDVPVKSYDFQAPLGEFGQMNESFRSLKIIHQFIADYGTDLAGMIPVFPDMVPSGPRDTTTLRIAARVNGNTGFLFYSNYLRRHPLPEQKSIQVNLKLLSETLSIPKSPVNIPSQSYFFWPLNLDLNGAVLKYATAEPFCKMDEGDTAYYFFIAEKGINTEFAFDNASLNSIHSNSGTITHQDNRIYINGLKPSTKIAIELKTKSGKSVRILLFSQRQALNSWKIPIKGKNLLIISNADVFTEKDIIHLRSKNPNAFGVSIFPSIDKKKSSELPLKKTGSDGIFSHYTATVNVKRIPVAVKQIRKPGKVSPVKMGIPFEWRHGAVAQSPEDSNFTEAGEWTVELPRQIPPGLSNIFLDIRYAGDVCRLNDGSRLIDDNFFNGTAWNIGLKNFMPGLSSNKINLKILALRKDAPIYIPASLWPDFKAASQIAKLKSIKFVPEYEVNLSFTNEHNTR